MSVWNPKNDRLIDLLGEVPTHEGKEGYKILVELRAYGKNGATKLSLVRHLGEDEDGDPRIGKLGRLTVKEALEVTDILVGARSKIEYWIGENKDDEATERDNSS